MAQERQPETNVRLNNPIGLDHLRERVERLLMSSEVKYGVQFDNCRSNGEFAYSWAAIWSEN